MTGGVVSDPHVFVSIDPSGSRDDRRAPRRNGHGRDAPACRWWSPTSWRPTGRASRSCSRRATRRNTATRTPTARAACATSSSQCANAARRCGRCSKPPRRSAGASRSARRRRRTTRSCTRPSGRKLGYGDLAAAASALPTPPADQIKLKDEAAVPLPRQGQCPDRRSLRHHDRPRRLWHRHQARRA